MRAFAITGMETASWMPEIISGSLILATPPSARMSAGTRSSAITATAPDSSAIFACSASTTSMMTPPLSIWAIPLLTLHGPGWRPVSDLGVRPRPPGAPRPPRVHHVHDDPALEHLGHSALDPERPCLPTVFRHRFCPRECLLESVKRILLPAPPRDQTAARRIRLC